ncbi:MAG: hypothetical protein ACTSR8_02375 [Promethearchaeota archaeon]
MILQTSIKDDFFVPLGQFAAFMVVILGFFWLIFAAYEANRRKSWRKLTGVDDWDFDVTKFLKFLTFFGFAVGIVSILVGAAGLIFDLPPSIAYASASGNEGAHLATSLLLIILGFLTFLKPLNDLPIASIAGLIVSMAICILLYLIIPEGAEEVIGNYINFKWILLIVFLITFAVILVTVKFYTAGLMALSKIISWPVIAIIVSLLCLIQGFALLVLGISLLP